MRARDDGADGSWGWSKFPLTISRIQRESIDKISRRGPRPDEIKLMKRIEAEAIRERRQHVKVEELPNLSPVNVVKFTNGAAQLSV